jgi:2-pyrone-4,6-dicarboxylate lactonase
MANTIEVPAGAPWCAGADPATRPPGFVMPPLACDSHAHICGPMALYLYAEERIYTPPDALLPDYRRMLDVLGVQRAVLVQPSVYGTDNTVMLQALVAAGPTMRGVAVVDPGISDAALRDMHAAGVRGLRFNAVDRRGARNVVPMDQIVPLARRIEPLGWHIELLLQVDAVPDLGAVLDAISVPVVLGHLGYVHVRKGGATAPGFQALLRAMAGGRCWVKLTGAYRISAQPVPYDDLTPMAAALLAAAPERLVWGTDWPHVKVDVAVSNDGDLADLLAGWVPDERVRHRILVENPAALYGFDRGACP